MVQYKKLSSKLIALTCIASFILAFTACKKNEDNLFLHNKQDATQTAFADETRTNGFIFTVKNNWVLTVRDATSHKNNDVSWLVLLCNEMETYSGNAGTFSMDISLELNYSGETRRAMIEIVSGDDKITVTVTQSGTNEGGEVPEPEPTVIDLSNAAFGGAEDIATLKIFTDVNREHLLVSTNVAETGYKITLPKPETVTEFPYFDMFVMSNPNAKFAHIIGPMAYNSNDNYLGAFALHSNISGNRRAFYIYADRDCNITGIVESGLPIHATCYFKKGWNIYYSYSYYIDVKIYG